MQWMEEEGQERKPPKALGALRGGCFICHTQFLQFLSILKSQIGSLKKANVLQ